MIYHRGASLSEHCMRQRFSSWLHCEAKSKHACSVVASLTREMTAQSFAVNWTRQPKRQLPYHLILHDSEHWHLWGNHQLVWNHESSLLQLWSVFVRLPHRCSEGCQCIVVVRWSQPYGFLKVSHVIVPVEETCSYIGDQNVWGIKLANSFPFLSKHNWKGKQLVLNKCSYKSFIQLQVASHMDWTHCSVATHHTALIKLILFLLAVWHYGYTHTSLLLLVWISYYIGMGKQTILLHTHLYICIRALAFLVAQCSNTRVYHTMTATMVPMYSVVKFVFAVYR